jgi:MoxR-like ATPase
MAYTRLFDPDLQPAIALDQRGYRLGDQPDQAPYVYDDEIVLAVNVALATGRPLLVAGEPGTGKSSLARDAARRLGWRFYSKTISSRTQARDLLWTFDTIRRLSDAQIQGALRHSSSYVEPGVLWWAFDNDSAARRGLTPDEFQRLSQAEGGVTAASYPTMNSAAPRAVVLLDEIDKADPDVPNDLLEPLGSFRFRVIEGALDVPVQATQAPLVFITTNDERDLPKAFIRRCVHLEIKPATRENKRLLEIARAHFPADGAGPEGEVPLHAAIAAEYFNLRDAAKDRKPSTAEYLDAVSACRELELGPDHDAWAAEWPRIAAATLSKPRESPT